MTDILDDLLGGPEVPDTAGDGCHLCQAAAKGPCSACDRPMCGTHAWTMLGVCTACARSDRMVRFHRTALPQDSNWLES